MKKLCLLSMASVIALLSSCAVHNQIRMNETGHAQLSNILVAIPDTGEFEVLYDRARTTSTSAVFFGLIGAAVTGAIEESNDSAVEEKIVGRLEDPDFPRKLEKAMKKTFSEERSPITVVYAKSIPSDSDAYDAVGSFKILQYGFSLTNQDSEDLSAYILMHVYARSNTGEVLWDDREKIISHRRASISDLQNDPTLASELLDYVANEAGEKIAYNIIYK